MMIQLVRTKSDNDQFRLLVAELDQDLAIRDGAEHGFYVQYNSIDMIRNVVMAFHGDKAVGCGAFKEYGPGVAEIKRMFVPPEFRSAGIATTILQELERWAGELGYSKSILETGIKQPEAIRLYEKNNYRRISNFGQYAGVVNSVCFEKDIERGSGRTDKTGMA